MQYWNYSPLSSHGTFNNIYFHDRNFELSNENEVGEYWTMFSIAFFGGKRQKPIVKA